MMNFLFVLDWSHRRNHGPFCHAPQLATLVCFRHATFLCVVIYTFFCVGDIVTISPSKSPLILSCTKLATLVCFQLTTFFLCPHWHIFLCPCHCYRSLILGSLPTPVVVLVPSPVAHVMSFIGRWILLGHGWRRKSNLMDPVVMCWIQPWCQMTAQFLWWDQFLSESLLMCSNATGRIY